MDTIKVFKVNIKKNGNKYRTKKRRFYGNRYTKIAQLLAKTKEENNSVSSNTKIEKADRTSNIVNTTSPTCQTQEKKDAANLKLPSPVKAVKILRKRKKVSYYSQETSSSSSEDIEELKPKRAEPSANKGSHVKEVAQSILMCILDKKQGVHNQCATSQRPSAQISRANKRQPQAISNASLKTGSLTPFHHNVHELMVLLTNTDSGNVEDIEAVIASVLEVHKQLDA